MEQPAHAAALVLTRDLLRIRREEPLLRPGAAHVEVEANEDHGWVRMTLTARDRAAAPAAPALVTAFNFSDAPRSVPLATAPGGGAWTVRLATEAAAYRADGGEEDPPRVIGAGPSLEIPLPAWSAVLLEEEV